MQYKVILDMSKESRIREMARLREKTLHDEASALGNAKREGEAIGMKKGKAQGRVESEAIGLEKGKAIGLEKGEAIGLEKGRAEERAAMIAKMRAKGVSEEMIKLIVSDK